MGVVVLSAYTLGIADAKAPDVPQERETPLAIEAQAWADRAVTAPVVRRTVTASGTCLEWMLKASISDIETASILIAKESGCNPNAINPRSGACGIPQALPCSKMGLIDPVGQLVWMQTYVYQRYGTWDAALAFHLRNGWY